MSNLGAMEEEVHPGLEVFLPEWLLFGRCGRLLCARHGYGVRKCDVFGHYEYRFARSSKPKVLARCHLKVLAGFVVAVLQFLVGILQLFHFIFLLHPAHFLLQFIVGLDSFNPAPAYE